MGGGKRQPSSEQEKPAAESAAAPAPSSVTAQGQPSPPAPEGEAADGEEGLDDLTVIRGIGPARQQHLYAAGIRSYFQLANASPEDVRRALSEQNQQAKVEVWISEARQLAAPSDI